MPFAEMRDSLSLSGGTAARLLHRGRLGRMEEPGGLSVAHRAKERQARSRTDKNAVPMRGDSTAGVARQSAKRSPARTRNRDLPWFREEQSSFMGMRSLFTVKSADAGWPEWSSI